MKHTIMESLFIAVGYFMSQFNVATTGIVLRFRVNDYANRFKRDSKGPKALHVTARKRSARQPERSLLGRQGLGRSPKVVYQSFLKIFIAALFLTAAFFTPCAWAAPERILSITPIGTEILYYLGLGDRVVGVTKYCTWPPEARTKPNLGDMMHVNLEAVVALSPDIVLVSDMNIQAGERIASLGYRTVMVYQDNFERICEALLLVGRECGVEDAAKLRAAELRKAVSDITQTVPPDAPRLRVLIVVGRDPSDDTLRRVYIAGRGSFYEDLLMSAGAVNACEQEAAYLQISREGLLRIDPDVIIELAGEHGMDLPAGRMISYWASVPELSAVRNSRVSVIKGDFTLRAGPRYPQILEAFVDVIHGGAREIVQ